MIIQKEKFFFQIREPKNFNKRFSTLAYLTKWAKSCKVHLN